MYIAQGAPHTPHGELARLNVGELDMAGMAVFLLVALFGRRINK